MIDIDELDKSILDVIRHNAKMPSMEISKKTGIPVATVIRRMKHLIDTKVITGFDTRIDAQKLGLRTQAYVFVRSIPGANQKDIIGAALKRPEIEDIAAIAGQFDILFKVRVKDTDALSTFLFEYVRKFPSVAQTETFLVLNLDTYQESVKKG
jgi:Lrp/AsnC family leucine-responsive transcriptional regulator